LHRGLFGHRFSQLSQLHRDRGRGDFRRREREGVQHPSGLFPGKGLGFHLQRFRDQLRGSRGGVRLRAQVEAVPQRAHHQPHDALQRFLHADPLHRHRLEERGVELVELGVQLLHAGDVR
jgi:hypothetical protein